MNHTVSMKHIGQLQAIGVPNGLATLAKIGNQMIIDTGCSNLQPIIHDLYPTVFSKPQNLRLNASEL